MHLHIILAVHFLVNSDKNKYHYILVMSITSNKLKSTTICGAFTNEDYPDGSVSANATFSRNISVGLLGGSSQIYLNGISINQIGPIGYTGYTGNTGPTGSTCSTG